MEKSVKSKLVNEIENQLDDFFSGQGKTTPTPAPRPSLEKLKSAVLSIDWEITEACLNDLIGQAEALMPSFADDVITHALLRMMRALGRYIRKRKAQSHQGAIKLVMSVFTSLETLVNDKRMDEQQKKSIVAKEIAAFRKLKEQIEANKAITFGQGAKPAQSQEQLEVSALLENKKFKQVINAVEERINAEVKELKAQLQSLQEQLNTMRKK